MDPCRRAVTPHLRVLYEALQAVHEVGAVEGVAADAHHCGLAQARLGGLVHGLGGRGRVETSGVDGRGVERERGWVTVALGPSTRQKLLWIPPRPRRRC